MTLYIRANIFGDQVELVKSFSSKYMLVLCYSSLSFKSRICREEHKNCEFFIFLSIYSGIGTEGRGGARVMATTKEARM